MLTTILVAAPMLGAAILALLYGGERAARAALQARLELAQATILRTQHDKELAENFLREAAKRMTALDQSRLAEIKRLEDILAQHPELAGDRLRAMGRRVLPDAGGAGTGAAPAVPGGPASATGKLGNH
jgi:hypothetical protein